MVTSVYRWNLAMIILGTILSSFLFGLFVVSITLVESIATGLIIISAIAAAIFITSLYLPRRITIDSESVVCHLVARRIEIPFSDIVAIKRVEKHVLIGSRCIAGINGANTKCGTFRNPQLGQCSIYITEKKNLVLISTKTKSYIFNLNVERDDFLRLLSHR